MTWQLQVKRIYDPQTSDEGTRILVMRLWPRGVKKSRVDCWLKELAPAYPLLQSFRSGEISWPEFSRGYKAGLKKPESRLQLKELRAIVRKGPATIFCGCADKRRCHRSLLKKLF